MQEYLPYVIDMLVKGNVSVTEYRQTTQKGTLFTRFAVIWVRGLKLFFFLGSRFAMANCEVVTFPLVSWVGVVLIVSIPDLCPLSYFSVVFSV